MLIEHKSHNIPIRKYYFTQPEKPCWRDLLLPTAYMDCYSAHKPRFFSVENRQTLLTDLSPEEESIFKNFPKDTRNQIRRGEQNGVLHCNLATDKQQFVTIFNRFATLRGLSRFSVQEIDNYGTNNYCLLSMDKDSQAVICHLYLLCHKSKVASLLASVSDPQYDDDTEMRKLIGHANRFLHWQGMRHLKSRGILTYDWCGYVPNTQDIELQGINRFKRTFNGIPTPIYNYYSPAYGFIEHLRKKLRK